MAINDLPTPTDSKAGLRSYRGATSFLVQNEGLSRGGASCALEACEPKPSPVCGSPPRFRPTTSSSTESPSTSRCRTRTPSPPHNHPSPPSSRESSSSKAPRSVSPGGTPESSAGAALRRGNHGPQDCGAALVAPRQRVRWADTLVSSVRSRPRTLRQDVAALFYSRADEKRFRREAEMSRANDEWCGQLEEDSLTSLSDDGDGDHKGLWSPTNDRKDYGISQAVVVFGNATRTYGGGVLGGCAVEAALEAKKASSFVFDDAAFWNGQLTWS